MNNICFRPRFILFALIAVLTCGVSFSQASKPEAKKPVLAPKAAPAAQKKDVTVKKAAGDLIDRNSWMKEQQRAGAM